VELLVAPDSRDQASSCDQIIKIDDQIIKIDWRAAERSMGDMALTTDKYMIVDKAEGDYYEHFDRWSNFKFNVAIKLTYLKWCTDMQIKFEARELNPMPTVGF
jgi:hypothetical protein